MAIIKINLFGASGHAKVIMDIIEAQGDRVGCLYDDAPHCDIIRGSKVYKAESKIIEGPLIISIGSNKVRHLISERYKLKYATAIHPGATVSQSAVIGDGSVVMQGAIIQPDAHIGRHCIINTGASVDHECQIEDYVHISPHATLCGNVHVAEGSWIGAGTTIIPGVKIGRWCIIGAGSVVIHDIPDDVVAYGNPCKIRKQDMQSTESQNMFPQNGGGNLLTDSALCCKNKFHSHAA